MSLESAVYSYSGSLWKVSHIQKFETKVQLSKQKKI